MKDTVEMANLIERCCHLARFSTNPQNYRIIYNLDHSFFFKVIHFFLGESIQNYALQRNSRSLHFIFGINSIAPTLNSRYHGYQSAPSVRMSY